MSSINKKEGNVNKSWKKNFSPLVAVIKMNFTHFQTKIDDTKINIKTRTEHRRIMAEACIDELL